MCFRVDAALDTTRETAEREIVGLSKDLVGCIAPIVQRVCRSKKLLGAHPFLQSSAILALSKLMVRPLRMSPIAISHKLTHLPNMCT